MNTNTNCEWIETLLVEDNPGDVELVKIALKRSHFVHRVTVARNGIEALAILRHTEPYGDTPHPSLVLLDLNLPKKNGMDVVAEMKCDPLLNPIRVVVFTSSRAEEDIAKAHVLKADEYVAKPVELDDYFAAMNSIGERHLKALQGRAAESGAA